MAKPRKPRAARPARSGRGNPTIGRTAQDKLVSPERMLGRIRRPGEYDESREENEYGNTVDFADAKMRREAGEGVNRYPGKCVHCSKSIAVGMGEPIHRDDVPAEKLRGKGEWHVQCAGASCLNKKGNVKGPATQDVPVAQGTVGKKVPIGKAGGAHHAVHVHDSQGVWQGSLSWHPRSGVIQSIDINPDHPNPDVVHNRLMQDALSMSNQRGLSTPRNRGLNP